MLLLIISSIVIAIDQYSKYYIKNNMLLGESIPVIPHVFHITYILNSGGAFGILQDKITFFIIVSIIAIVTLLVFYYFAPIKNYLLKVALALILGGAIGNFIDRILYRKVVDFFDFRIWPVFNIADIAICTGMGLLILDMFINNKKEKIESHEKEKKLNETETIEG